MYILFHFVLIIIAIIICVFSFYKNYKCNVKKLTVERPGLLRLIFWIV
jgi:hypothetical protein